MSINLEALQKQYSGSRFGELIKHQLRRQSQKQRIMGLLGTKEMLPEVVQGSVEGFIDQWNTRVYDEEFWQRDTASVFDEIVESARNTLRPFGLSGDDEAAFNLFNIVVLNYAYSAHGQAEMRRFMGIERKNFPWLSGIAMLYPIAAALYLGSNTPVSTVMVLGYGVSNLGYLLAAAAIFGGSFGILGLHNRPRTFGAAVVAWIVGVALSNVGA